MAATYLLATRCPVCRRRDSHLGSCVELGNLAGDAAGAAGGQVGEQMAELSGGRLRTFQDRVLARGARPAYKIGAHSYLVVDPSAAPVLRVMSEMQQADPATRAAFIRNPRQAITEAVTAHLRQRGDLDGLSLAEEEELIEKASEPVFVETLEYSERVIGVKVYEGPSGEGITESGTTWLPEAFLEEVARAIEALPPEQVEGLITQVRDAIAAGDTTVEVADQAVPATPATLNALEARLERLTKADELFGICACGTD